MTDTALVPLPEAAALSALADSPLPIFTGAQMAAALTAYRDLQKALDKSMPEQIMTLDGKPFRKKGYWRAIAVAFGLKVEPIEERRDVAGAFADGRENFGYVVTYRASAPNGRSIASDGTCFAVEKARRFKCPHPERPGSKRTLHFPHHTCPDFDPEFQWRVLPADATEHNVRGHAHTRAFNRAVSNLVGFGEVSAEEVVRDGTEERHDEAAAPAPSAPASERAAAAPTQAARPSTPETLNGHGLPVISEPQAKRFGAIARDCGHDDWGAGWLKAHFGLGDARAIPKKDYDRIVKALQDGAGQ